MTDTRFTLSPAPLTSSNLDNRGERIIILLIVVVVPAPFIHLTLAWHGFGGGSSGSW